jgi:hypothetical protein
MSEKMLCKRCGKPTTADEWYRRGNQRVYIHYQCMVQEGQELIERGKHDSTSLGVRGEVGRFLPDAPISSTTATLRIVSAAFSKIGFTR